MNNKITALRQSLARIRLARESLKNRLKINSIHRDRSQRYHIKSNMPSSHSVWNTDFPSINNNNNELKDSHATSSNIIHAKYLAEIERLGRKLQQRDETLKRVLQAKSR